jgi:hypothetical protein
MPEGISTTRLPAARLTLPAIRCKRIDRSRGARSRAIDHGDYATADCLYVGSAEREALSGQRAAV